MVKKHRASSWSASELTIPHCQDSRLKKYTCKSPKSRLPVFSHMLFLMEHDVSVADHVDGSAFLNQYPKITL